MAVNEELKLSVTVQVDDTPLEEYDAPEPCVKNPADEGAIGICRKYVEVKDGAKYGIRLEVSPDHRWISDPSHKNQVLRYQIYIDGDRQ